MTRATRRRHCLLWVLLCAAASTARGMDLPDLAKGSETAIEVCGFERLGPDWAVFGAKKAELATASPHSGKASLKLTCAGRPPIVIKRPFQIHSTVFAVALFVRASSGAELPAVQAELSNGRIVAMKKGGSDDALLLGDEWAPYTLDHNDIDQRKLRTYFGGVPPDPLYIEGFRIEPATARGTIELDTLTARVMKQQKPGSFWLIGQVDAGSGMELRPGARPAFPCRVLELSGTGGQVELTVAVRDLDTPTWATVARAAKTLTLAPAKGKPAEASTTLVVPEPLPAGTYLACVTLTHETLDRRKRPVTQTLQTDRRLLVCATRTATRLIEGFELTGSCERWLVRRGGEGEVRLATHRGQGGTLDARHADEAHGGDRSLRLISREASATLCLARPLAPSATRLTFWLKTVAAARGAALEVEIAGRYGTLANLRVPLQAGGWRQVALDLHPEAAEVPLALAGLRIRGGAAEVLIDDVAETLRCGKAEPLPRFLAAAPRTMLGLREFPAMFRSPETRHFNPVADHWCGNEAYFEAPTGKPLELALAGGPAHTLAWRLLGVSANEVAKGTANVDANGSGSIRVTPPAADLYCLEIRDGAHHGFCRILAVPSRPDPEELAAAAAHYRATRAVAEPPWCEPEPSRLYDSLAQLAERRSPPTEKESNDAPLTPASLRVVASALTPAVLFDVPPGPMRFFTGLKALGMGGPTFLACPTREGMRVVPRGGTVDPASLAEPWVLAWFHGAKGWDQLTRGKPWYGNVFSDDAVLHLDFPHLLIFARPPARAKFTDGLALTFAQRTRVLLVPLYGRDKPPAERTATWAKALPAEVAEQCRRWVRTLAWVPVDVREYYALDGASGDVVIRNVYDFLRVQADAKPEAVAAPVPPCTALAADAGLPVDFDAKPLDLDAATMMGPARVVPGRSQCTMRVRGMLRYVHEVEEAKEGRPLSSSHWKAIDRQFDTWSGPWRREGLPAQFTPGDQNYYIYERAGRVARSFPYIDADLRDRARRLLYRASRDYFLEPTCFTAEGPAINTSRGGGWWGDRCKHTTSSLYNVWQYAYYGGLWGMVGDRWSLVRRMNCAEQSWMLPGPNNWAEHYHHGAGPGTIAHARMAWVVGDLATYCADVHLATKILIGEAAWVQGAAPYIAKHLPWDQSTLHDAIPVELSTVQGFHLGGCNPGQKSAVGGHAYDGIHENFWVFGSDVLLRFWRDHLQEGTRRILAAADRATPGWDTLPETPKMPTSYWSLLKMRLLVLGEPTKSPDATLRKRVHYSLWTGPDGGTSLAHVFSLLRSGRRYRRIIPPASGPLRFIEAPVRMRADYIAGGLGLFDPGIGIYQPVFLPPKPLDAKWAFHRNALYAGFHRSWKVGAKVEPALIRCGNARIRLFNTP